MRNRMLAISFLLSGMSCLIALSASAQTLPVGPCVGQAQFCPLCGDPGIGFFNCVPEITILEICNVWRSPCAPPSAADSSAGAGCTSHGGQSGGGPSGSGGGSGGSGGAGAPLAGSPINLITGNTFVEQADFHVPGLGGGLSMLRRWNSKWPSALASSPIGLFGPNWRSTYEERVFVGSDYYIKYARSDGSVWSFGTTSGGWGVAAPASASALLTYGAAYWTLTFQNGEQRRFNSTTGSLIAIIDRNGNTTQLTYDSIGRLTTVTDPASRHLNFTYANPNSNLLVTNVTSDMGISLTYTYDSQNRLSQVTNPDLTTLTFAYDSQSRITAVTDSNGKILESHTYDSTGRGLTCARANGVEAVTVTYQNQ